MNDKEIEATKERICCVCGHNLSSHIEEKDWYRCHSIGSCYSQCECRLIKEGLMGEHPLEYYDLEKRQTEFLSEIRRKRKKV